MTRLTIVLLLLGAIHVEAKDPTWWFLVEIYGSSKAREDGIVAKGPFPSEAICKAAGRAQAPTDRRFFTAKQEAEAKAQDALREAAYRRREEARDVERKAKRKPGTDQVIKFADGTEEEWTTKDEIGAFTLANGGWLSGTSQICPCRSIVTACVTDDEAGAKLLDAQP